MPKASALSDLPAASRMHLHQPNMDALRPTFSTHKPRILILYGSLRTVSYSRLLAQEAARLLEYFGCEVRIFNPEGLPLPDEEPASHPKVQELRELSAWHCGAENGHRRRSRRGGGSHNRDIPHRQAR